MTGRMTGHRSGHQAEVVSQTYSQAYSVLSERELEIVDLVAAGMTNEKIAERLEISKRTVDNHISNILNKTSSNNRVELLRWALQWGKVCLDQVNCCVLPKTPTVSSPLVQVDMEETAPNGYLDESNLNQPVNQPIIPDQVIPLNHGASEMGMHQTGIMNSLESTQA